MAGFSTRDIAGIPDDWEVTLYDTGKATMVKVTTPVSQVKLPESFTREFLARVTGQVPYQITCKDCAVFIALPVRRIAPVTPFLFLEKR